MDSKYYKADKYDDTYSNHDTFRPLIHENLLIKIGHSFSIMKNREIYNVQQHKEKIEKPPHILGA